MSRGMQGTLLRALGANEFVIRVDDAYDLVPGLRRVHCSSPSLFEAFQPGPTDFVRLWFPDPVEPDLEVQRGYTITDPDPATGTFVLDIVLHEPAGPAATWAQTCQPGDEVAATSYGSQPFELGDPEPAGVLLIGDAASLPAINSILGVVPHHLPVEVFLEWSDEREHAIPVAEHPSAAIHRLPRELGATKVVDAIANRDWSDWKAWIGAERITTKLVKAALRDQHGFPKSEVKATPYWIHGRPYGGSRGAKAAARAATEEHTRPASPRPSGSHAGRESSPAPAAAVEVRPGRWRANAGVDLLDPVRSTMRLAGVIEGIVTLAGLVPFVLLAEVGRRLLDGQTVNDQWPVAKVALIILGSSALAESALMLWLHVVDARFALDVRRRLLAKLARLPLGWFTDRNGGIVKQAVTEDTARLHSLVTHAAPDATAAVVAPLAVLVYLFVVDARLAAVLLIPVIAYVAVFSSMTGASRATMPKVTAWARRMDGEAGGYLQGLPVVRVFGGSAASRFRRSVDEYTGFLASWQRPFVSKKATAALITDPTTFLWIIVAVGGVLVASHHMAGADLLPFLLLGTTFGPRLLGLAYGMVGVREAREAAKRIGLTLTEDELETMPDLRAGAASGGATPAAEVRLEGVTFEYRPGHPVLRDVDVVLPAGTVTALVGPSGSGKSTLAALVARFHDPIAGRITIGGDDLRALAPDDLYQRVGFVLQDVHLLRETVHDNIALARPHATRAEVVAAAEAAAIAARIDELPHGYDTVLGDEVGLSGGEAQRITIARAILADTPVVVLDEATAFADPEAEHQVQVALGRLLRDRTVLVIAHRLHTIVDADQIVVLDGGRVVQRGTHGELVHAVGRYRDLWRPATVGSAR
ncbi:MAG TPA: ATP-binding cassette domain-containing protein [Acidimicrobiales bacterium]|jgi:ATP-binding cassette subfamily B protein IrtA|nr:ATP-binding cassette domain-containing protein [Acidimicrobiales bacterium]